MSELGQLEYCHLHQPELYDLLYNGAGTPLDEGFGEGGINSAAARVTNAWQDPAEGRRQMLLHFANIRNNNDLVTFLTQGQHLGHHRQLQQRDIRRGTPTGATILELVEAMEHQQAQGLQPQVPVGADEKPLRLKMMATALLPRVVEAKKIGAPG